MLTYTDWKHYIENGGDLRALNAVTADWLLELAIDKGDIEIVESCELYLGG